MCVCQGAGVNHENFKPRIRDRKTTSWRLSSVLGCMATAVQGVALDRDPMQESMKPEQEPMTQESMKRELIKPEQEPESDEAGADGTGTDEADETSRGPEQKQEPMELMKPRQEQQLMKLMELMEQVSMRLMKLGQEQDQEMRQEQEHEPMKLLGQ